jgi:hypothetical protein
MAETETTRVMTDLVSVMKAWPRDAQLQCTISGTVLLLMDTWLQSGAPNMQQNFKQFLSDGGMDALVAAMDQHKDDIQLQKNACCIICDMGNDMLSLPSSKSRAAAKAVLSALERHIKDTFLATQGLTALVLLCPVLNQNQKAAKECIRVMVTCMRVHVCAGTKGKFYVGVSVQDFAHTWRRL